MTTATLIPEQQRTGISRIDSIDLLRGIVMIIMALDHVRDYFHADAFLFNPLDLEQTNPFLFSTRWITHFCAPVFVFLAGTSAYFVGGRKGKYQLSSFLLKRGLWLLLLEFTVINFAWFFNIQFSFMALTVIWALGVGMIALSIAIYIPFRALLLVGLALVAGHNLLDNIFIEGNNSRAILWSLLHVPRGFELGYFSVFVAYPVIPWIGVMILGYCTGSLYGANVESDYRRRFLIRLGFILIALFVFIRLTNSYGDPVKWTTQKDVSFTIMSFMNVTKYPPSLLYLMITIGPSLILLAYSERIKTNISQYVVALGRVPMFYYIAHLFLIHIIAIVAAIATGYQISVMVFTSWVTDSPNLRGYGFSLVTTYLIWASVVFALYPLCLWYDRYKIAHRQKWWLSYL